MAATRSRVATILVSQSGCLSVSRDVAPRLNMSEFICRSRLFSKGFEGSDSDLWLLSVRTTFPQLGELEVRNGSDYGPRSPGRTRSEVRSRRAAPRPARTKCKVMVPPSYKLQSYCSGATHKTNQQ